MALTGFSPKTRQIIQERCENICEHCGLRPVSQHHHRRPRSAGGSRRSDTNTPANALACCEPSHRYIESHRTEALENGWLVRQGHDPATVPVLYRGSEWVLFKIDGSIERI